MTKEDTQCHKYVCSVLACFPSGRIITIRASAGKGQQKSSVSRWPIHNVRQHNENASETSIWRELTASNHENPAFSSWAQTCSEVDLRICYIGFPELLRKSSLICLLCSLAISLQTNGWILSTSRLKTKSAQIVLLFLGLLSLWSHYYSSSFSW